MCVCGGICTNKLLNLRLFVFRHINICNHYCQDVSNLICTDRRTCRKSWASLKNLVEMLKWYTCSLLIWKCKFGFCFLYTVIQWFRWNTCIFEEGQIEWYIYSLSLKVQWAFIQVSQKYWNGLFGGRSCMLI